MLPNSVNENNLLPWQLSNSSCASVNKPFLVISNSYSTVVGIYGSKPTEPEGAARGQGRFTVAINP